MKKYFILLIVLCFSFSIFSQKMTEADSSAIMKSIDNALNFYGSGNQDSARYVFISTIGEIKKFQLKYPKNEFLQIQKIDGMDVLCAIYMNLGNYHKAIAYADTVLRYFESEKDTFNVALSYNNMAFMAQNQNLFDEAERYFLLALKYLSNPQFLEKSPIYKGIILNNLGLIYEKRKKYDNALEYYNQSLSIRESINDKRGMSESYNNIGNTYRKLENYNKGLELLLKAEEIKKSIGDNHGLIYTLNNISSIYFLQNDTKKALKYGLSSYELAHKAKHLEGIGKTAEALSKYCEKEQDYASALKFHKEFTIIKDSLTKQENRKALYKHQVNHEYEKKETLLKMEQEKKDAIKNEELKRQKIITGATAIGLILMLITATFIYRNYVVKKNLSEQLSIKNKIVEEKNVEILQSINYAKRLQQSILPPPRVVKEYIAESFILYLPKDIVAGDFYWLESVDNKVYFAAADCTGHGVPGAMVVMVCYNALNRALLEFDLREPSKILDKVNEFVEESFSKGENEVRDGMDISLCCLDKENMILQWTGANNPLWIIRNFELVGYKPDKQPVGKFDDRKPFTNHTIQLIKGDSIYVFTDGFADQFGGENEKNIPTKE